MPEAKTQVTIENSLGLHARPAMTFVDTASGFDAEVRLHKDDQTVDAKSIMQVMMLAAAQGTTLTITAEGADAQQAVSKLEQLVVSKFDEE